MSERPDRVSLEGAEWFYYYLEPILFLGLSVVLAVRAVVIGEIDFFGGMLFLAVPFALASAAFRWSALGFQEHRSAVGASEGYRRVLAVAEHHGWSVYEAEPGERIVAEVGDAPGEFPEVEEVFDKLRSRPRAGERVEVRFDRGRVYVNSVVRPGSKPSLTRWGKSREHTRLVARAVGAV